MLSAALNESHNFRAPKEYWLSLVDENFDPDQTRQKVHHTVTVVRKLRYMQASNGFARLIDALRVLLGFEPPRLMRSRPV